MQDAFNPKTTIAVHFQTPNWCSLHNSHWPMPAIARETFILHYNYSRITAAGMIEWHTVTNRKRPELYTFKRQIDAACITIVTDLCPRLRAKLSFCITTVHESRRHEWLNDTQWQSWGDHSCTLLNAKSQNSCIFTHRNYVYIVAMCISYRIWAT